MVRRANYATKRTTVGFGVYTLSVAIILSRVMASALRDEELTHSEALSVPRDHFSDLVEVEVPRMNSIDFTVGLYEELRPMHVMCWRACKLNMPGSLPSRTPPWCIATCR